MFDASWRVIWLREREITPESVAEAHTDAEALEETAEELQESAENAQAAALQGNSTLVEQELQNVRSDLTALQRQVIELRQVLDTKATSEHSHPLPGDVQTIADALSEVSAEEREPSRTPWYRRRMGR